jgi:glycosyltransferase involved in cell wall biosynthesis
MVTAPLKRAELDSRLETKILWVSSIDLSVSLHMKSKIEIMGSLTKRRYSSTLIAIRSANLAQTENSQVHLISIPLRPIPIISRVMYAIVLLFFLPLHVLFSKPNYIIVDPFIPIFSFALALPLSKLIGIKLILDIRSVPVEISGSRGFLQILLFTTSVSFAKRLFDGMTIITHLMKTEICRRFDLNPERVGVWSSGVSLTLFNPETCSLEGSYLKEKLGLIGKFIVLYHGVFSANRGLIETIEAMSIVKNAHCNVIFLLLGTGPLNQRLKELIMVKKLQDFVIIHSPVEHAEVPKFIALCDVGIVPLPNHPYWQTQSPLKLLEYLAMSKVVVITSIAAHRSVVGKERCGVYISSANPLEIAKSIIYAYNNREKLEEWGMSGRKIVEEGYTWEKIAADLENYLLSIDDVISRT